MFEANVTKSFNKQFYMLL